MEQVFPEIIEEMTQRLIEEFHPEQIILFGSRAWGLPDEGSDVDLLVVVVVMPSANRCALGWSRLTSNERLGLLISNSELVGEVTCGTGFQPVQ